MSAVLRPAGFRKRGSVFHRTRADVAHLVSLQSSVSSTADACRVTVNLAVWLPRLYPTRSADVWSAPWNQRLGFLMPEADDRWWQVDSDASADAASVQIRDGLSRLALPVFDSLSSEQALLDLWRSGKSPGIAAAHRADLLHVLGGGSSTG
jgi:hypothetical protein